MKERGDTERTYEAILMPANPEAGRGDRVPGLRSSCGDRAQLHDHRPTPDRSRCVSSGKPVVRRTRLDPAVTRAAPPCLGDVPQLDQPGQRVAEGHDRVALGLVRLAEEQAGGELAAHPLDQVRLLDRATPAGRRPSAPRPGTPRGSSRGCRPSRGSTMCSRSTTSPTTPADLAIVRQPARQLARQGVALGQAGTPSGRDRATRRSCSDSPASGTSGQQRARQQRRQQEEVDGVVLVEVEVHPLLGRDVQHDARRCRPGARRGRRPRATRRPSRKSDASLRTSEAVRCAPCTRRSATSACDAARKSRSRQAALRRAEQRRRAHRASRRRPPPRSPRAGCGSRGAG